MSEKPYNEVWTGHILKIEYFKSKNGANLNFVLLKCIILGYLRKPSCKFRSTTMWYRHVLK